MMVTTTMMMMIRRTTMMMMAMLKNMDQDVDDDGTCSSVIKTIQSRKQRAESSS